MAYFKIEAFYDAPEGSTRSFVFYGSMEDFYQVCKAMEEELGLEVFKYRSWKVTSQEVEVHKREQLALFQA